jgi:acyl dehydratase
MDAARFPEHVELEVGPVRAIDLALYAAASGDHNPLHLDADTARAAGFERPIVHGMLAMAYAGRLLTQHFGTDALRSFAVRFVGSALLGDRIVLSGQLTTQVDGIATYALRGRNGKGEDCILGTARVALRVPGGAAGEAP